MAAMATTVAMAATAMATIGGGDNSSDGNDQAMTMTAMENNGGNDNGSDTNDNGSNGNDGGNGDDGKDEWQWKQQRRQ